MTAPRPLRASADSAFGVIRLGDGALRNAAVKLQPVLITGALAAAAIATGWLVAEGDTKVVVLVLATALIVVLAARAPGALAALLMLAAMNGIPIISLNGRLPGGLHFQDGAVIALGVLLFAYRDRTSTAERARLIHVAVIWSGCFVAWWTFTLARSVALDGIPVLKAMLYCRDFLYFALLLPLVLRARLPPRFLRDGARVLIAGVVVYAVGAGLISLAGVAVPSLVHPGIVDPNIGGGLSRVYSPMSYLVNTCLIFTGALLLSRQRQGRRWRLGGLALLLILTASLQLGRANYFALAAAFVAGTAVYLMRYGSPTAVVIRGAMVILVLSLVVIAFTGVTGGSVTTAPVIHDVVSRINLGLSNLSQSSGTIGYRERIDNEMLQVLGGAWPVGLGFLYPAAHYVVGVPFGAIRNTDTGVLNILMTLGIVGVLLIYAPLVYGIRELMRAGKRLGRGVERLPQWIIYGSVAWIVWIVAGSPTLVVLFSIPGVVVVAVGLGLIGQVITTPSMLASEQNLDARGS